MENRLRGRRDRNRWLGRALKRSRSGRGHQGPQGGGCRPSAGQRVPAQDGRHRASLGHRLRQLLAQPGAWGGAETCRAEGCSFHRSARPVQALTKRTVLPGAGAGAAQRTGPSPGIPPPPPAPRDADRRPGPTGLVRTRSSQRPSGRRQGRVRQTPPGTAPDAEHQRQEADTRLRPRRAWLSLWLPRSPSHRHRTGASRHQCDQFHIPGGGSAARHPAPPGDESRLARSGGASGSEKAGPAWLSQAEAGRTAVP